MSRQDPDRPLLDSPLDRAVGEVADDAVAPETVEAAAARVWERLARGEAAGAAAETSAPAPSTSTASAAPAQPASLRGCDDFQRLIPAHRLGALSPARQLLLEDHLRSCVACRRAWKAAAVEGAVLSTTPKKLAAARRLPRWGLAALAALLVAALGFGLFTLYQQLPGAFGSTARVESAQGGLYRVASETVSPLAAGARFGPGVEVRTGRGGHAVLRLADGSRVEVAERATLSYEAHRADITVDLAQGRIIVQAAKQTAGRHLYVQTPDCRVSVVGTIFAVNHGIKGSRVSVVEGEVRVRLARRESVLYPGGQVATRATVAAVPVADEVAWSADAGRYDQLLSELAGLSAEADAQAPAPGLRTSTGLLDLAPEGTLVWVGLPNVAPNLAATQGLLDQRLAENPLLKQWWDETVGSAEKNARFHAAVEALGDLGRYLGEEVAIAVTPDGPVALAQVTDPRAFRAVVAGVVAKLAGADGGGLVVVDSPDAATSVAATGGGSPLFLWPTGNYVVAAPKAALLAKMAALLAAPGANPFVGSPFHQRVAAAYRDGVGWLFAGDLKAILARRGQTSPSGSSSGTAGTAEALGLADLDGFVVDRREAPGRSETRAAVTFDRPRRGIASWLAAPAPMGALAFVSPDATAAAAFVVRNPSTLLDELLAALPNFGAALSRLKEQKGIDLHELAAPLGGEVVLALDGPVLPTPSWKLVAEVYDPAAFARALGDLAAQLDRSLRADGKPGLSLTQATDAGRIVYTLRSAAGDAAGAGAGREVDYTFVDGYFLAAPSRALLDQAIATRDSGSTLATSAKLQKLLPTDGQLNVSALLYQNIGENLGSVLNPLSGALGSMSHGRQQGAAPLFARGPSLTYAYGEEDRILFAGASDPGPLGTNLGLLASFGRLMGAFGNSGSAAAPAAAGPES